jgi:hypothetical protein
MRDIADYSEANVHYSATGTENKLEEKNTFFYKWSAPNNVQQDGENPARKLDFIRKRSR